MLQTISRLYQSVLRFKHQEQSIIVQPTFKEDSMPKPPRKLKIITSFRNIPKHCKPTIPSINPVERCHCELSPVAVTAEVIEITSDWGAKVADFRWGFHEKNPKNHWHHSVLGQWPRRNKGTLFVVIISNFQFSENIHGRDRMEMVLGFAHPLNCHTNQMIVRYFCPFAEPRRAFA